MSLAQRSLAAPEFLPRFLLHVVPRGFMRIRHYGLTANRHRQRKLHRARGLLGVPRLVPPTDTAQPTPPAPADSTISSAYSRANLCPRCGAPLRIIEILPPTGRDVLAPAATPPDIS